jgi:hypothetical protein
MVKQDWIPSTVTLGHLQNPVKHVFVSATELKACRVPKEPALPAHVVGYVVSFTAFHERGFNVPSHPFLRSLLWYYGLELHHLPPFRVLHIAVFVTMCEAYLGVDPDLDFFRVHSP